MAQKMFYIDSLEYKNKVRKAILDFRIGINLTVPDAHKNNQLEVFYFGGFRTTLLYGGKNSILIAGGPRSIEETRSRLETISNTKLTEVAGRG